jgi:oxygen-independent coproporphyrinogen-3 oxidase
MSNPLGLYIHIPFCAKVCHYCDFAKTANFFEQDVQKYFAILTAHLREHLAKLPSGTVFSSVFFGGGTPSLFVSEYLELFEVFRPFLGINAEISIEANPNDISSSKLEAWRTLGFNRISIGVQTFDELGLRKLTRDHDRQAAIEALQASRKVFSNINCDLIYGWEDQTSQTWQSDLEMLVQLKIPHVSLYALTFEGRTPFVRRVERGVLKSATDKFLEHCYLSAMHILSREGYNHEEISNWSRPGFSCQHNWIYWRGDSYVGVGAGAHGYLNWMGPQGLRYSYDKDFRRYLNQTTADIDQERSADVWLMEYVGCSLRTFEGIDLRRVSERGFGFAPDGIVKSAISERRIFVTETKITLPEAEWFRETAWSSHLLSRCFTKV